MIMTITGFDHNEVLRLYAQTDYEEENLTSYTQLDTPLIATLRWAPGYNHPCIEIRKEADKCQNTHKH